ncbi:PatA/PatG family cyanobactin maturation protease [Endothiovibrio diazotrophicus]
MSIRILSSIPAGLDGEAPGDPRIKIAVLDGPVDFTHPCFAGANMTRHATMVGDEARADGEMSRHGTHVASLLFGQPGSPLVGVAPRCAGLILPVFSDRRPGLSQLDLSRAIRQAIELGAHVISISGGQAIEPGAAEDVMAQAVELCRRENILVVAAAGNDGCACLHSPAALPTVLAVGAMDHTGRPLSISNWGEAYRTQGILAPGEDIPGAVPGGGIERATGTSFAAPIVSGVAALLLSHQLQRDRRPDPQAVRAALLASAGNCTLPDDDHPLCLVGTLNPAGALALLEGDEEMNRSTPPTGSRVCTSCSATRDPAFHDAPDEEVFVDSAEYADEGTGEAAEVSITASHHGTAHGMAASGADGGATRPSASALPGHSGRIYVLGVLGYDFGTEARRDTYKQLMPAATVDGVTVPANPYDARQMVDYLEENLSEARSLIWTVNLELTPIYALETSGAFARDIYEMLHQMLDGQIQAEGEAGYIERVSIPGRLTERTVRLFSGQVVPVVEIEQPRGMYGWNVTQLRESAVAAVRGHHPEADDQAVQRSLSSFLNKIYYELRNLGQTSQERALNFAATNAFQVANAFSEAIGYGMELDTVEVRRSPFCRMDSDCWDVVLSFFDPDNVLRARKLFRFTVDVSDAVPVTMGEVRSWSSR